MKQPSHHQHNPAIAYLNRAIKNPCDRAVYAVLRDEYARYSSEPVHPEQLPYKNLYAEAEIIRALGDRLAAQWGCPGHRQTGLHSAPADWEKRLKSIHDVIAQAIKSGDLKPVDPALVATFAAQATPRPYSGPELSAEIAAIQHTAWRDVGALPPIEWCVQVSQRNLPAVILR